MTRPQRRPRVPDATDTDGTQPGVTRFDLVCRTGIVENVLALTRRWAEDRALRDRASARLAVLVRAAMAHGLRFDPRTMTLQVRWLDRDRIRVDLRWFDCAAAAKPSPGADRVGATTWLLDTVANTWGIGRTRNGWVHWIVVDTR